LLLVERIKLYGYVGKRSLKRIKRTPQFINSEYNDGVWNKDYDEKLLESMRSMYGHTEKKEKGLFIKNGKYVHDTYGNFGRQYWNQILSYLSFYKNSEIVELGCGLGFHLFELQRNGFLKLHGYDISKNAIKFARIHNKKIDSNIEFDVLDIIKPLPDFSNKIIFTHYCLEQLKHYMKTVIQNIVDSTPNLVINIEVDYDSAPFIVKMFFKATDCQDNLMRELKSNPEISIISSTILPLQMLPLNRLSCIQWKPQHFDRKVNDC